MITPPAAPLYGQNWPGPVNVAQPVAGVRHIADTAISMRAVAACIGAHAVLSLAMHKLPAVATAHAIGTLCVGLWLGLRGRVETVAIAGAYIVGAEVLWRMTRAGVVWETGKYTLAVMFTMAVLRMGRRARWQSLPLLYFALFLPSVAAVLYEVELPFSELRQSVSSGLSGPLALMACVWFLSQLRMGRTGLQRVALAVVVPVTGIAAITLASTYTASPIRFTGESNFVTSGGWGPNQVSTALGLGALFAYLVWSDPRTTVSLRCLTVGLCGLFVVQGAMTFSRGGIYAAVGAVVIHLLYTMRQRRARKRVLIWMAILTSVLITAALPRVNAFTEGKLAERFEDRSGTKRSKLMVEDLHLWARYPLLGTGPGRSKVHRADGASIAHTEFTRVVAEHGSFGAVALLIFLIMVVRGVVITRTLSQRALTASLLAWSILSMFHSAIRTAAPGFVFGLALMRIVEDEQTPAIKRDHNIV
jgi:hypothetical protein